ncbi:MAG: hypothetical protein HPY54_07090 [Chthonomonadetes bacterium]|nr:hypothetical protein [Chthonomonadetes bacterium]
MNHWRLYGAISVAAVALFLAGCGGSIFRSTKVINDPLTLRGRSASVDVGLTGDALACEFTVDTPVDPADPAQAMLSYDFGNTLIGDAPLQPYEGMESLDLSQKVRIRFQFTPNTSMPNEFTLRNVNLRIWLRLKDTDAEGASRSLTPIQMSYSGTLTLKRQVDGSYQPDGDMAFTISMNKQEGWSLLNLLASGDANTAVVALSLRAETSSTNVPPGATARLTVEFAEGSARVLW